MIEESPSNDLINFNTQIPTETLPSTSSSTSDARLPILENLLDTELPELEQKLTKISQNTYFSSKAIKPVELEEILIRIDDEDENEEALKILENLDEILNEHLNEADNSFDLNAVTECLEELDEYLRHFEENDEENQNENQKLEPKINSPKSTSLNRTESTSSLRLKLRKIEENYAKYLTLKKLNVNDSSKYQNSCDETKSKTFHSCYCAKSEIWSEIKSQFFNALTTLPRRKLRPKLAQDVLRRPAITTLQTNQQNHNASVQSERLAHASGVYCTGTVVVETPRRESPNQTGSCSSETHQNSSDENDEDDQPKTTEDSPSPQPQDRHQRQQPGNQISWTRNSMRHLRRLRLPLESETLRRAVSSEVSVRPSSAPANSTLNAEQLERNSSDCVGTRNSSISTISRRLNEERRSTTTSSSETSLASSSFETGTSTIDHPIERGNTRERIPCERNSGSSNNYRQNDMPEASSPLGQWPHSLSSTLACLSCSLGLFNISRFAVLTVHFGLNFVLQFMILSLVFGLPLYTLQMCLGQQLGAGVIDMWRISPLFQGVGVSLFICQALIGVYSIIGVSWMFVFFRDSFITRTDKYKWTEPFILYHTRSSYFSAFNQGSSANSSLKLQETIPDYFNGVVLQRHHLSSGTEYGTIKFQMAFNLAVVWMIVFVCLSKGLKSYGKVIYVFTLVPVFGMFILSAKILGMIPPNFINSILPEMYWNEFFTNSKSWLAAAQETFLTWGLLGAAVMQITSHNKEKRLLHRDSSLVAVITFIVLILVAFLANTCVQILKASGYNYVPSSFERMNSYLFLKTPSELYPVLGNTPIRYMDHNSFIIGERITRPSMDSRTESGYQVLRFCTELIPATFAILGSDRISSFWAVMFYFILILFGIAQQLAIWHCVITGIIAIRAKVLKSWETTITFFSCSFGFLLGLPMATELGIYVVYVLDYTVGGFWWLLMVIFLQIVAVFMVRGRPYSGDNVVTALFNTNSSSSSFLTSWIPLILSFIWNVILPVGLVVLCVVSFKNGHFKEMFVWHNAPIAAEYWPLMVRQIGSMLQLLPILCIPIVAVIQSYRYLNSGTPPDILERIQMLYRPPIGDHMDDATIQEAAAAARANNASFSNVISEDPPPKYTPPPSYTTATGARIAKFLRQSIRRSVRRIASVLGETSTSTSSSNRVQIARNTQLPPPDYSTVLVEMNLNTSSISVINPNNNSNLRISTLERLRNIQPLPGSSLITAAEVACILRSSFRRSTVRRNRHVVIDTNSTIFDNSMASLSAENLIDSAAPIGETSLVLNHNCTNSNAPNVPIDENIEDDDKTTVI